MNKILSFFKIASTLRVLERFNSIQLPTWIAAWRQVPRDTNTDTDVDTDTVADANTDIKTGTVADPSNQFAISRMRERESSRLQLPLH